MQEVCESDGWKVHLYGCSSKGSRNTGRIKYRGESTSYFHSSHSRATATSQSFYCRISRCPEFRSRTRSPSQEVLFKAQFLCWQFQSRLSSISVTWADSICTSSDFRTQTKFPCRAGFGKLDPTASAKLTALDLGF